VEERIVDEREDKMKVTISTGNCLITGVIELFEGARLTDYLSESGSFIAVTNADVLDGKNKNILTAPFMNVHRDNIEVKLPV